MDASAAFWKQGLLVRILLSSRVLILPGKTDRRYRARAAAQGPQLRRPPPLPPHPPERREAWKRGRGWVEGRGIGGEGGGGGADPEADPGRTQTRGVWERRGGG